jgi:hypothetical protein
MGIHDRRELMGERKTGRQNLTGPAETGPTRQTKCNRDLMEQRRNTTSFLSRNPRAVNEKRVTRDQIFPAFV